MFSVHLSMSANPRWWPYRIPIEEAFKKSLVLIAGVAIGAVVVTKIYKPLEEYDRELERGKIDLLNKYKKIHEDRLRLGGHLPNNQ